MVNRDEGIGLEKWFKILTNQSVMLRQCPPKPHQFCDNCKMLSYGHYLKEVEMKITYACPFLRVSQKSEKNFRKQKLLIVKERDSDGNLGMQDDMTKFNVNQLSRTGIGLQNLKYLVHFHNLN